MRRFALIALLCALCAAPLLLTACTSRTVSDAVTIARSPSSTTVSQVLGRRAVDYAANPQVLERDLKAFAAALKKLFERLEDRAEERWGKGEAELPGPKKYVKYLDNYQSRCIVDFEAGTVVVETVDQDRPMEALREAVVVTLLTPRDPRAVDLFTDSSVQLGAEPYLYGLVKDHEGEDIRWEWRAGRFADWLVQRRLQTRSVTRDGKALTVRSVRVDMVPGHLEARARQYLPLARKHAEAFGLDPTLVLAIMRVESDFNPFAVSHAGALGLMQVVPSTAGRDVYQFLNGRPGHPSGDELFDPDFNIRYGSAYLHIVKNRYLPAADPISREYCAIAAYNGGPGSVQRVFAADRAEALRRIDAMPPDAVYDQLTERHPASETRRYLWKVVMARREFRAI